MDKVVLEPPSPEEQERLNHLQGELEGLELTALLEKLQKQFELSVNQMADAAGIDESALHKIINGENREFKAEHVNALLDFLEHAGKLPSAEKEIWLRALRVSAFLHFDLYKAIEPRLRQIEDPVKRVEALETFLREQYPALAETYDKTGGTFPVFLPLFGAIAREMNNRWGWIRIPSGYELNGVKGDHYFLYSTDIIPRRIGNLGPDLEIEDTGIGTYTVRRRIIYSQPAQVAKRETLEPRTIKRIGGIEFVHVPKGSFLMGSKDDNKLAWDQEKPQHTVEISYEYWMAKYVITNEQYAEYLGGRKEHPVKDWRNKKDHPAVNVLWNDAMEYCKWFNELFKSELGNLHLELPTEAEWEKAARGTHGKEWPWGNEFEKNKCNSTEGKKGGTTPVGLYSPLGGDSPYGCADMAGNVRDWCSDWHDSREYENRANGFVVDPRGPTTGNFRVLRGGGFNHDARGVRCACRDRLDPGYGDLDFGFRVVVSPFTLSSENSGPLGL